MKTTYTKTVLSLILTFLLSFAVVGCTGSSDKEAANNTVDSVVASECSEQDIRMLMEKNLDCVYCFFIAGTLQPKNNEPVDTNGYYIAENVFDTSYSAFEEFVGSVYVSDKTNELLTAYPNKDKPLYKKQGDNLLVNPNAYTPIVYKAVWDDTYDIEITSSDLSKCEFTLTTVSYDDNGNEQEYKTNGCAVYENGNWLLSDIVY